MTLQSLGNFLTSWKGIVAGVFLVLGMIGADGRITAQKLNAHLVQVQDQFDMVDGLALAACLKDTNPRDPKDAPLRQKLRCRFLEDSAGVIR